MHSYWSSCFPASSNLFNNFFIIFWNIKHNIRLSSFLQLISFVTSSKKILRPLMDILTERMAAKISKDVISLLQVFKDILFIKILIFYAV